MADFEIGNRFHDLGSFETSDQKPPDKEHENAGPVGAGTGVKKKLLAKQLLKTKDIKNRSGHQLLLQQRDTHFGIDHKNSNNCDIDNWQSLGSVVNRVLPKGAKA